MVVRPSLGGVRLRYLCWRYGGAAAIIMTAAGSTAIQAPYSYLLS